MNVSELKVKPCPFCGSDDISFSAFSLSPDAYALCGHCNAGIEIQVGWDEMTEKEHDEVCNLELQKVWNRRSVEQPLLNENQQIVLEYLKDKCNVYSFIAYKPFEAILRLSMLDPEKTELKVKNTIDELTYKQQAQVLQAFSQWAQEQEED